MDICATDRDLTYTDLPPVLIAANSPSAVARAEATIAAANLRIAAKCAIEDARDRIEQQVAASLLWIEVDRDDGGPMDDLLDFVGAEVADGRFAAVVSATESLMDPLAARLGDTAVELIIGANETERAATLAVALAERGGAAKLSDVAADKNAARLRQLSDEVSRIASTLARLSAGPTALVRRPPQSPDQDAPAVSAEMIRSVIRARRLRARYFSEELFADPAWDMLLDLLQAEIAHLRVPVSSLCIAAAVPATTALRWLKTMVREGLFIRRADPHDGRRVFVELAPRASNALHRYFAEVGPAAVI